ncbi:MAG: S41 family peptidase [Lachnospiraceae bacterium]|nr:S41 family peptidase [Lachnospiraceae bacterium]
MEEKMERTEEYNRKPGFGAGLMVGILAALVVVSIICVIIILLPFDGKFTLGTAAGTTDGLLTRDVVQKVGMIKKTIDEYYLNDYSDEDMANGIYQGMLDSLGDPYADYYTQEELQALMEDSQGIYYGIGAYIMMDKENNYCVISGVIEGTPAEEADIHTGDIIYKVDDVMVGGMDSSEVVKLIKGEEGTYVHITFIRDGEADYVEKDVERRKINTPTVSYEMLDNKIGYIAVSTFDEVTVGQFSKALKSIREENARGLILDLRDNTGGSLAVVCDMCRELLPQGIIVYTVDKNGERDDYTNTVGKAIDIPMVVLVNDYTASASEIMTGALKDYGLAKVIGITTFGKGIVQKVVPLIDGTAVKMTISKYYTPSGVCIHGTGIEPDIEVEFDADKYVNDGTDNQLEAAIDEIMRELGE